jgi:hypothetical protein
MRIARPAVALTVGAAVVLALPASAVTRPKVKPVCKLVVDGTQDTFAFRSQDAQGAYGPQEDGFDIVSGDVASNAKTLTGVLRVKKLSTTVGSAPNGIDFRVNFALPGQDPTVENFFLNARIDSDGSQHFFAGHITRTAPNVSTTVKLGDGTGKFDAAKNEVRISVPLAAVKQGSYALKNGMKLFLSGLDQTASRVVVVNPTSDIATATFADVANSDKVYVAGAPSCVTPGV